MYRLLLTIPLVAALGACDTTDQSMAAGALGGALIGAAVSSSDDRAKGAIIGGVAGALFDLGGVEQAGGAHAVILCGTGQSGVAGRVAGQPS